jgi:protein SCO1/2
VDPAYDTPEVLRAYAERYKADPERWWLLTGPPEAVSELVRGGFHLAVEPSGDQSPDVVHSTRLALVDTRGQIRGYYDGTAEEDRERLLADLERLIEEG